MVDENGTSFSGFRPSENNDSQHSLLDEVDEYEAQELDYSSDEQNSEDETSQTQYGRLTKKLRVEKPSESHTSYSKFTRKYQGAAVYKSKFQLDWQRKWPCITPVKDKRNFFYCTVCGKVVSCGHQGEKDVKRHMESELHKKNVVSVKHTTPLKFMPSNLKKKESLFYIAIIHFDLRMCM